VTSVSFEKSNLSAALLFLRLFVALLSLVIKDLILAIDAAPGLPLPLDLLENDTDFKTSISAVSIFNLFY